MTIPLSQRWRRFWVKRSHHPVFGKVAARIAAWNTSPFHGRLALSRLHPKGYVAASASVTHPHVALGKRVYLGDRVIIACPSGAGSVELHDNVQIYGDAMMTTGAGGRIVIGAGTHIQPGVHIHAHVSEIRIGQQVEIAPRCAFYSYNHCMAPGELIMNQALESKGPISVGTGAWLGHGVIVLAGVTIGQGAVIGAGSVVTRDVPENGIAAGNPAKVIGSRDAVPPERTPRPRESQGAPPVPSGTLSNT
jgi:acetyltransferase-like isoleucine patch superfamily enzyme